jgi:hypothetical protein
MYDDTFDDGMDYTPEDDSSLYGMDETGFEQPPEYESGYGSATPSGPVSTPDDPNPFSTDFSLDETGSGQSPEYGVDPLDYSANDFELTYSSTNETGFGQSPEYESPISGPVSTADDGAMGRRYKLG